MSNEDGIEPFDVTVSRFSDIDWNTYKPARIGVLPYIVSGGHPYWIFGVDNEHNELATFSGGARYKSGDNDALSALRREWKEETLNIFGPLDYIPDECVVMYYKCEMCLVLIRFDIQDFTPYCELFHERRVQIDNPEMSNIVILNNPSLVDILINKAAYQLHDKTIVPMYSLLHEFLSSNMSFLEKI